MLGGRAVRSAPPGRCASVDPRRVGSSRHSPTATRRKADAFSRSRPDGACAVVHRLRFWLRHFQSRPQAKRAANSPTAFSTSSSMRMFRTRAWGLRSWQFTDCAVWKIDAQLPREGGGLAVALAWESAGHRSPPAIAWTNREHDASSTPAKCFGPRVEESVPLLDVILERGHLARAPHIPRSWLPPSLPICWALGRRSMGSVSDHRLVMASSKEAVKLAVMMAGCPANLGPLSRGECGAIGDPGRIHLSRVLGLTSIVPWLLLPLLMAVLGAACLALLQEQQRRATVTTPLPPPPPLTSGAAAARFDCDRWPRDETSLAAVESPPDAFSRDARMAPSRGAFGQVRLEASRGGLPASEESSSLE
ncbi:unnamed protein product [Lampetra planeri]